MKKIMMTAPLLGAMLLSSCTLGPNFLGADAPELPATWTNAMPPASDEDALQKWWASFKDPQLDSLINQAFTNNPDMITAALAISRAEAELRSTGASLLPSVSGNLGGSRSGVFESSATSGRWNGGLSASWTPDIWGGTRRQIEASMAGVGSTVAAANATRTALASSVAVAYFEWISAKESLRVAQEQLELQERTFAIVKQREGTGMASGLDLAESRSTIASTRAQIPTYEANIKSCENTLATLLGVTVDQVRLSMPSAATYNRVPRVPTGLPADMLRRRPDIVRAECELHAATANVGVNVAALFPNISLTGSASSSSGSDFAHFFSTAGWSLGASASQTIFNRTALNERVNMAELSRQSAAQSYRKTVLAAFAEVESNLITYAKLVNQLPWYSESADANRTAAELSMRLYNAGNSDFLNVASSERARLSAELNLISTRQQIRITLARLCTSLGGGWDDGRRK